MQLAIVILILIVVDIIEDNHIRWIGESKFNLRIVFIQISKLPRVLLRDSLLLLLEGEHRMSISVIGADGTGRYII